MSILTLRNISISFSEQPLLQDVDLQINAGEKICLIGRNGEGKTTLLKIIEGLIAADSGEVSKKQGLRIASLSQEVPTTITGSVYDVVKSAFESSEIYEDHKIKAILSQLSLDPDVSFAALSGGLKRQVLFAKMLVTEPDLLLFDEPTNHLDIKTIEWLENLLTKSRGTILFITHDRTFLQKVANRIIELDRAKLTSWECDYVAYLTRKEAALLAEEQAHKNFDKKLAVEEYWVRHGISARRKRNQGRVRKLQELRQTKRERRTLSSKSNIKIQEIEKSGKIVIEAKNIVFYYPNGVGIKDFSTTIMRGDKIGIIGANGCGKTTLLKLLLKELEPQTGELKHGTQLKVVHFDQLKSQLKEELSVRENVSGGSDHVTINGVNKHVMGYLQDFLFTPAKVLTPIKKLSGGEKSRLLLAKLFVTPANFLILDEPTNDLDIETLELLENLLVDYQGTLIIVSHDRTFLNNIVTSTVVFEENGEIEEYVGGYDDWLRQRKQEPNVTENIVAKPKDKSQKESYQARRELNALLKTIEKLETKQNQLYEKIAAPEFYQQNQEKIAATQEQLQVTQEKLQQAYERWEKLDSILM